MMVLITFEACDEERKVDVIMFDVDSKELSEGLSCPPKPFVDKEFLKKVARCLTERGLFVLNLVCRDDALRELLFKDLKEVFSSIVYVSVPEEVNVIVFCKCSPTLPSSSSCFEETISKLNKYLISQMNSKDDVLSLSDMLKNFHVL
ncbi:Methyltransferase-like protein 13 [Armadillidium vulgare]|nr:Methyltransferase-like protein 13 [Armadillidium vulgare]